MSRKRGRPKEAAADSGALALQPAPQKRGRWAAGALPEPSHECQVSINAQLVHNWLAYGIISLHVHR